MVLLIVVRTALLVGVLTLAACGADPAGGTLGRLQALSATCPKGRLIAGYVGDDASQNAAAPSWPPSGSRNLTEAAAADLAGRVPVPPLPGAVVTIAGIGSGVWVASSEGRAAGEPGGHPVRIRRIAWKVRIQRTFTHAFDY